jgi:hypothetical protein
MLMIPKESEAVRLALEPQNRVYAGVVQSDGGLGGTVSVESRLTQLVAINIGGFFSTPVQYGDSDSRDEQDWVLLNHGLWAAPGWRVPHRYGKGNITWDLVGRAGFACVFTTDAFRDDLYLIDPAGLVGLDGYLQYKISEDNTIGLRMSNKMFAYQPDLTRTLTGLPVQRFQHSIEVFWQL